MGVKNCPETPRQKMINMMYIVLTAMLALNVAAEVLEAFKVVDNSLTQTLKAVDMKNAQVYAAFEQAYFENEAKVGEWKGKADQTRESTESMISYINQLKEDLVRDSGFKPVNADNQLTEEDFYYVTAEGDTLELKKEDDLNAPSELMITQRRAYELKEKIIAYREALIAMVAEQDTELKETLYSELETADAEVSVREGGGSKEWETQHFLDKPLIAILTLLSKIQIDVKNAEANLINYLYAQIDAGSFKFNDLEARVIANSKVVLQGQPYEAEVFLAAEDTTQQPVILINGREVPVEDGKAVYNGNTSQPGVFTWSGLIKYKTPSGIIKNYPFEQEYQVTKPSVTMSASRMNVFYRGLDNPFEVSGGAIPNENLEVEMTNGRVIKQGDNYIIRPQDLDERGTRTKITVYTNIGGERQTVGTSDWRVKPVPDPVAQVDGQSGGEIRKEILEIQDGVMAVLEDFDFDFKYTVTQFEVQTTDAGGYTVTRPSNSNRFTTEQKEQFQRLTSGKIVYIGNIRAVGDDGSTRSLDPISFKIR